MEPSSILPVLVACIFAIATAISVSISFYLYRWRRIITNESALFVPEQLISTLSGFHRELHQNSDYISKWAKASQAVNQNIHERIAQVGSTCMQVLEASTTWQNALDERDEEIRRLRSGYEFELFRRFIARFVRVKVATDSFQADGEFGPVALNQISRLLEDAFEECGVEQFSPQNGEDYRTAKGVADNPETIVSPNPQDAFRIASTVAPGYRSRAGDETNILIPARVSIYMYRKDGGVE